MERLGTEKGWLGVRTASEWMYSIARPFMDLYLVSASSGEAKNLTSSFEDQVSNPTWSPGGKTVFFRTTDNQTYDESIYKYEVSNGKLTALTQGKESYRGLSTAPGKLALTVQSATHPPDLFLLDTDQGTRSQITELNPQLSQFRLRPKYGRSVQAGRLLRRPKGTGHHQRIRKADPANPSISGAPSA